MNTFKRILRLSEKIEEKEGFVLNRRKFFFMSAGALLLPVVEKIHKPGNIFTGPGDIWINEVHVDVKLTKISVAYSNPAFMWEGPYWSPTFR